MPRWDNVMDVNIVFVKKSPQARTTVTFNFSIFNFFISQLVLVPQEKKYEKGKKHHRKYLYLLDFFINLLYFFIDLNFKT